MIKELVMQGRSYRNYEKDYRIEEETLLELVDTARLCPSGANIQPLKYKLIYEAEACRQLYAHTHWGMKLKNVKVPFEGMEPTAYIAICRDTTLGGIPSIINMDTGIAAQTIMLAAAEKGLNCCFLGAFNAGDVQNVLGLAEHLVPQLIVALGKGAETVEIVPVPEDGNADYYREGMVNYVPKRSLEEIIIR